jgi:hypothetical protein
VSPAEDTVSPAEETVSPAEETVSAQGAREDVPRNPEEARTSGDSSQSPEGTRRAPEEPPATGPEAAGEERQQFVTRWKEIQAEFVDEPKSAVAKADALVVETLEQLAAMFERERSVLEQRWSGSSETSTEELRQSLRRYRALLERLLAA